MRHYLIFFFLIVSIFSCSSKSGKILPTAKMQAVMWDMLLADAYTQKYLKNDSTKNEQAQNAVLQQKIFQLHKINKEDFYASYEYYNNHPDIMRAILDSINVKEEKGRSELMTQRYSGGSSRAPHPAVNADSIRRLRPAKD